MCAKQVWKMRTNQTQVIRDSDDERAKVEAEAVHGAHLKWNYYRGVKSKTMTGEGSFLY